MRFGESQVGWVSDLRREQSLGDGLWQRIDTRKFTSEIARLKS